MKIISILLVTDARQLKSWVSKSAPIKLLIILMFIVLGLGLASGGYYISSGYFKILSTFESYGKLTADYSFHAAIIVTLWILIFSSLVSYTGMLTTPGKDVTYLILIPHLSSKIGLWLILKSFIANTFLLILILLPVVFGYGFVFNSLSLLFLFRITYVLILLSMVTTVIGSVFGLYLAQKVNKNKYLWGLVGMILFFFGLVIILRLIFPPSLFRLYDVKIQDFNAVFQSLPLNQKYLPTYWLTEIVTKNMTYIGFTVTVMIIGLIIILLGKISEMTPRALIRMMSGSAYTRIIFSNKANLMHTHFPILIKDILWIIRDPKEAGYAVFLAGVSVFFFISLCTLSFQVNFKGEWQTEFIQFAFAWIFFFATAYGLRFLFVRIVAEGKSIWHILTLPVKRTRILAEKSVFALLAGLALAGMLSVVWLVIPFARGDFFRLTLITFTSVLTISISNLLFGTLIPDFSLNSDPEKASTSPMGLSSLVLSLLIGIGGILILRTLYLYPDFLAAFLVIYLGLIIAGIIILTGLARNAINNYEY